MTDYVIDLNQDYMFKKLSWDFENGLVVFPDALNDDNRYRYMERFIKKTSAHLEDVIGHLSPNRASSGKPRLYVQRVVFPIRSGDSFESEPPFDSAVHVYCGFVSGYCIMGETVVLLMDNGDRIYVRDFLRGKSFFGLDNKAVVL